MGRAIQRTGRSTQGAGHLVRPRARARSGTLPAADAVGMAAARVGRVHMPAEFVQTAPGFRRGRGSDSPAGAPRPRSVSRGTPRAVDTSPARPHEEPYHGRRLRARPGAFCAARLRQRRVCFALAAGGHYAAPVSVWWVKDERGRDRGRATGRHPYNEFAARAHGLLVLQNNVCI